MLLLLRLNDLQDSKNLLSVWHVVVSRLAEGNLQQLEMSACFWKRTAVPQPNGKGSRVGSISVCRGTESAIGERKDDLHQHTYILNQLSKESDLE